MSDWRFTRPDGLPLPQPAEHAQPFFDALREHRLVVQRCAFCQKLVHPPRAMCGTCRAVRFDWVAMRGTGTVYSHVVTHQAVHPALVGHTPLATVEVELIEGPRLFSNLVDVAPEAVVIGMAVQVVFETVAEGVVLPLFRRADDSGS